MTRDSVIGAVPVQRTGAKDVNWRAQCAAIIPCLDEAATIGPLVEAVRRELPTVLVVDDGSRDATATLAAQAGAMVLGNEWPCGKGAALQAGWHKARELGFAWALTLDGDGQHVPEVMESFFRCAEATGASLVVGNRMLQAQAMPWLRRSVNRWMSRRLSTLLARELPDSQCGFRLVSLSALASVVVSAQHFEIESEMLVRFIRGGYRVEFMPVPTVYGKQRSKIHPLRDTLRWWRWWRKVCAESPNR
jgi:glycosyltransferase involved in cell wall biosynthesis